MNINNNTIIDILKLNYEDSLDSIIKNTIIEYNEYQAKDLSEYIMLLVNTQRYLQTLDNNENNNIDKLFLNINHLMTLIEKDTNFTEISSAIYSIYFLLSYNVHFIDYKEIYDFKNEYIEKLRESSKNNKIIITSKNLTTFNVLYHEHIDIKDNELLINILKNNPIEAEDINKFIYPNRLKNHNQNKTLKLLENIIKENLINLNEINILEDIIKISNYDKDMIQNIYNNYPILFDYIEKKDLMSDHLIDIDNSIKDKNILIKIIELYPYFPDKVDVVLNHHIKNFNIKDINVFKTANNNIELFKSDKYLYRDILIVYKLDLNIDLNQYKESLNKSLQSYNAIDKYKMIKKLEDKTINISDITTENKELYSILSMIKIIDIQNINRIEEELNMD